MTSTFKALGITSLLVGLGAVGAACESSSNEGSGTVFVPDGAAATSGGPEAGIADAPSDAEIVDANGPDATSLLDVYVDPVAGIDTNAGGASAPFKTIKTALAAVPSGSTVWLADGSYTAANQGGATAIVLPDNARISAKNVGLAVLEGLPVTASGASAAISGVVFDLGSTLTATSVAAAPTLTLDKVHFKSRAGLAATLAVAGNTKATVTQATFDGPLASIGLITVAGAATLAFVGGTIDGGGGGTEGFGYALITATGTSKLTLDGLTMKNDFTAGILAAGSSAVTPVIVLLRNGTVLDTIGAADDCGAGGSVILGKNVELTLDAAEIKNAKTAGICVTNNGSSTAKITLQNGAKLTNDVNGVRSQPGTGALVSILVNGATFTSNVSAGIYLEGAGTMDLTSATMTGNAKGIVAFANGVLSIKARKSSFSTNTTSGIDVTTALALTLDLGTVGSVGMNTLAGNATTGLRIVAPTDQTQTAVGNTWNASIQGADAAGHYTAGTNVVGPTSGTNHVLVNASTLTL